jgi:sugar phosphate isomerase/epimerase
MDETGRAYRARAAELAVRLGARGIKFNVGKDPAARDTYLRTVRAWRAELPDDVHLLCECHPGTIIEEPAAAKAFFDELGTGGWGIIVHPFSKLESLPAWFDAFGPAIVHAHLQMRTDDWTAIRFDRRPERAKEAVRIMRAAGYTGSCTFEFTEGMNAPGENADDLFANALIDLAFLKEILTS